MMRKNKLVLFIILIVAIVLALRSDNTPDTAAYRLMYEDSAADSSIEFLYIWLNRFFNQNIGLSFDSFLLILTISLFLSWYKITNQIIDNLFVGFVSFLPFYGFYFFGITLRASIAVVISYLAIVILLKNKSFKGFLLYYIFVLLASGFHQSALVFLVLPLIALRQYKKYTLYLVLLFSATLPLYNDYIPIIKNVAFRYLAFVEFSRVEGYVTESASEMMYSFTLLKNLVFGGVFIFLRNKLIAKQSIYNFFLNTYLIGCLLLSLFSFVTAGSRLAIMFLFFEFILLTLLFESSNIKKKNKSIFMIFAAIINFIAIIQKGNGLLW